MRTFEEACTFWPYIERCKTINDLRSLNRSSDARPRDGLRSTIWRVFLLFDTLDTSTWPSALQHSREAYGALQKHYLHAINHQDEIDSFVDPLSEGIDSPWDAIRKDELLRQEIFQDVERCMPDNLYFREPDTQTMLLDILFIWAKLNPTVGYRQGMHEIAAPILWVVERDAVSPGGSLNNDQAAPKKLLQQLFDARFIANDTFTLFSLIMQSISISYEHVGGSDQLRSGQTTSASNRKEAPIVERCQEISTNYLARVDPNLAAHLTDIGVVPQIYLIRWLRLLFGREFSFDQTLRLWDRIFAEDRSAYTIDIICVAMLLRIRWELLDADYNFALQLLLKYPELTPEHDVTTLVDDAVYLKTHLNNSGGREIISRRTGRRPPLIDDDDANFDVPLTPAEPPSRNASPPQQADFARLRPVGLEGLLEDAARGIMVRGERWNLTQAVKGVVGEVRKNVQQVQSRTHSRMVSRIERESPQVSLQRRVEVMEQRNKALSKMLDGAVGTLWASQKTEPKTGDYFDEETTNDLTTAIAKVQLVSVYLADSTLVIPEDETVGEIGNHSPSQSSDNNGLTASEQILNENKDDALESRSAVNNERHVSSQPAKQGQTIEIQKRPTKPNASSSDQQQSALEDSQPDNISSSDPLTVQVNKTARPRLAQSQFSWMLGQDQSSASSAGGTDGQSTIETESKSTAPQEATNGRARTLGATSTMVRKAFMSASPFREGSWQRGGTRSVGGKGFLFGDEEAEDGQMADDSTDIFGRRSSKSKKGKGKESDKDEAPKREERKTVLRMSTMKGKESKDEGDGSGLFG